MLSQDVLDIICCPDTKTRLVVADGDLVVQVNKAITSRALTNRAKKPVLEKVDGGLVREDGRYFYPVRHDIPVLLIDEAIPLPLPA